MFLLTNRAFLLLALSLAAGTFDWVFILAQGNTVCKERFFRGVAFSAVQQSILAVIIFGVFGNTGRGSFKDFFNRLYKLSLSLNV